MRVIEFWSGVLRRFERRRNLKFRLAVPLSRASSAQRSGVIVLEYIDAERHAGRSPDLSQTGDMFARMVEFVGRHVR